MKPRPDLIVPIRDRRQRKRYLTLKNSLWFALAAVLIFAGLTIRSETGHKPSDDYGRILGKQVSRQELTPKKFDVIAEAPVPDQTAADPMLLEPARREQYLGVDEPVQPLTTASVVPTAPPAVPGQSLDAPRGKGVNIVGDANGVAIVQGNQQKPVLSGGIFKQQ